MYVCLYIHATVAGKVQESDPVLDSLCQLARDLQRLVKVSAMFGDACMYLCLVVPVLSVR